MSASYETATVQSDRTCVYCYPSDSNITERRIRRDLGVLSDKIVRIEYQEGILKCQTGSLIERKINFLSGSVC